MEKKKMTYEQCITYTPEIHEMNAAQIWAAWKQQKITVHHLATWQQRHNYYFTPGGEKQK
jgi:hypothetical protein